MKYTHLSGPNNSTQFTDCCGLAIMETEGRCPGCKEEVYPGIDATPHERETARWRRTFTKTPPRPRRRSGEHER